MKVFPSDLALAKEFVHRLAEQVDPQLFTVTLFGSRARGDADEESDLDLFVALKKAGLTLGLHKCGKNTRQATKYRGFTAVERKSWKDDLHAEVKEAASRIACDLTLESGILVSVFVADREFRKQHEEFAFLQTVEEEGVPL